MSVQSASRMSTEQPIVEQMTQTEPDHDGVIEMPDDQEHRKAVVYMVNCALGWVDENYKLRDRLITSRALITRIRERVPCTPAVFASGMQNDIYGDVRIYRSSWKKTRQPIKP